MNLKGELIKNTIVLAIGQLVPKILMIVALPILTSSLATSEYGIYDLALTLSSFLLPIITLQIHQAVFRELLNCRDNCKKKNIVKTSMVFVLFSGIFVSAILMLVLHQRLSYIDSLVICVYIMCEAVYTLLGQTIRGVGKNIIYSKGAIVYAVVNTAMILFLFYFKHLNAFSAIASIAAGYFIAIIYFKARLQRINGNSAAGGFNFTDLKELLRFSIPILPSAIALWIVNLSDRLIVTAVMGMGANGIYSVANRIPNIYNTAYSIFNMAWIESASKAADEGDAEQYYSNLFEKLFTFLTGAMLIIIAVLPILFKVLINDAYSAAYKQIIILFWGAYFNSYVSYYGGIYIALKKTKSVAISSFSGAVLNMVINIAFISHIGLYAASISTAVSFGLIMVFRYVDMRKLVHIQYNKRKIIIGLVTLIISSILAFRQNYLLDLVIVVIAIIYNFNNRELYNDMIKLIIRRRK